MNVSHEKNVINFWKQETLEIIEGRGAIDLPRHTHNSYVIGVITSGKLKICMKEKEYHVEKGTAFIVPSNVGISMQHETSYSYTVFCFSKEAADYFNKMQPSGLIIENVGDAIQREYEQYRKKKNQLVLMEALKNILHFSPRVDIQQEHFCELDTKYQIVQQAVAYMKAHVEERYRIEEVADALYISKYHFSRIFKEVMDITPKQYMMQTKLRRVKELIIEESSSTKVAIDMDYAAQSHLCNVFKKYMGISICDYKKHLTIYS